MFAKSKVSQSMIDAVNSVLSEDEKKKMLLEPELDETGFHKAAHAAKKANQSHFEFQGKKYPVTAKSYKEAIEMDEASLKIPTATGTKVLGGRYGNSAKAHVDQHKNPFEKGPSKSDLKGIKAPSKKELKTIGEDGDCVTKPEAKKIAKKEVSHHNVTMHKGKKSTVKEGTFAARLLSSINEGKGPVTGAPEEFTDNNLGEEEMTDKQTKKREKIVLSMKKGEAGFKQRYGKNWKNVMYATATKQAMKEDSSDTWNGSYDFVISEKAEEFPVDKNAPKEVKDRKTGKMYNPNKEFAKTMNSLEVKSQLKRMAKEDVELDEARMSAAAKLSKAFDKEQLRSAAARRAGQELLKQTPKNQGLPFDPDKKSPFKTKNNPNRTGVDIVKALAQKGMNNEEVELDEKNDSHTHAAHYENEKGEWSGMKLFTARDDRDAIQQAHKNCEKGCRLSKVERHMTVKEEVELDEGDAQYKKNAGTKPMTDLIDPKKTVKDLMKGRKYFGTGKVKEEVELVEHDAEFAKKMGFEWHRRTYGAEMKHSTKGTVSVGRYGGWVHKKEGKTIARGDNKSSLEKHLNGLKEETELEEAHKVGDTVTVNSKFFGKQKGKVTKVDGQSIHVQRDGKKASEKYPHDAVMKEEFEELDETLDVVQDKNAHKITTDMLSGRVPGGKLNSFKNFKVNLVTSSEEDIPKNVEKGEDTKEKQKITTNPGPVDIKLDDKLTGPTPYTHFSDEKHVTSEDFRGQSNSLHKKRDDEHAKEIEKFNKKVKNLNKEEVEELDESRLLDKFLMSKGLNPEFLSKDAKIAKAKSNEFKTWAMNQRNEEVQPLSGVEGTPIGRAKGLARKAFKKIKQETMMGKIAGGV